MKWILSIGISVILSLVISLLLFEFTTLDQWTRGYITGFSVGVSCLLTYEILSQKQKSKEHESGLD